MAASSSPPRLLSTRPAISPEHSGRSNSSADARGTYFFSVSPRAVVSRGGSPCSQSERLASRSGASDYESGYSSDSNYLTPPQSQGDDEKPPYKARSAKSPSLDMSARQPDRTRRRDHKHRAKQRSSKHKRKPRIESDAEHESQSQEHECRSPRCLPGCTRNTTPQPTNNVEESPLQFGLTHAANVPTHRWSPGGVGADMTPRRSSVHDMISNLLPSDGQKRSNSLTQDPQSDEIMKVVRARLTFREVAANRLPTPATITLRRASGMTDDNVGGLSAEAETGTNASLFPNIECSDQLRRPVSTYLITTDDVDFITNLIQPGFDLKKTIVNPSDGNAKASRKLSVTSLGVLPLPSIPADLTTTIEDVHQARNLPHVTFGHAKGLDSKQMRGGERKSSRALSLRNIPEVIWEDTGSPESSNSSSNASSNSGGRDEVMNSSSIEWLLGQSISTDQVRKSPSPSHPDSEGRKGSDDGDKSPTSRIFQWVFKEPTEDRKSPKQSQSSTPKQPSPILTSEREPCPSITLARPNVVSFPPLPSRQFTKDWISPLPDMSSSASDDGKFLSGVGIDAQVGNASRDVNTSLPNFAGNTNPQAETEHLHKSAIPTTDPNPRRKSSTLLHPQLLPRLGDQFKVGNAIGSSSGARRKSSTHSVRLRIDEESLEHHYREDQKPWTKARKDSGWPSPKTASSQELASRKGSATTQQQSVLGDGRVVSGHGREERSALVKRLEPLLSTPDHAGIYAALTGTGANSAGCGTHCTGHLCGESLDPRKPSSDWIG